MIICRTRRSTLRAASGATVNADVLLRNTMKNEWRYSDDDRYTMKSNAYSTFSTLWKIFLGVFHGMENIRTGRRPIDTLPRCMSAKPRARLYENESRTKGCWLRPTSCRYAHPPARCTPIQYSPWADPDP